MSTTKQETQTWWKVALLGSWKIEARQVVKVTPKQLVYLEPHWQADKPPTERRTTRESGWMSTLTDALAEFVDAVVEHREYRQKRIPEQVRDYMERRCERAGIAYETALAQFTADVARHAVT